MQNLQHPYGEIFAEIKILLTELSQTDSYKDLLDKENELNHLYQKFSFLKISNQFDNLPNANEPSEAIENQETKTDSYVLPIEEFPHSSEIAEEEPVQTEVHDIFDDVPEVEEVHSFKEIDEEEVEEEELVEEVSSFADMNDEDDNDIPEQELLEENTEKSPITIEENQDEIDYENEKVVPDESDIADGDDIDENVNEIDAEERKVSEDIENLLQSNSEKLEPMQDSQFFFAMNKEEIAEDAATDDYEQRLAEKESKLKELEDKRRQIVELSKNEKPISEIPKTQPDSSNEDPQDKRFRLANIKGLKIAKSLFDDDHLEELEQKKPVNTTSGSLLKNNLPTDYMEAPKPKPEFKLDLNDRIAFSQHLFGGSQSELNQVVTVLNSFTSLDKAQEFLSDIYYERDWKKVDSYAQRLWTLVENRFL